MDNRAGENSYHEHGRPLSFYNLSCDSTTFHYLAQRIAFLALACCVHVHLRRLHSTTLDKQLFTVHAIIFSFLFLSKALKASLNSASFSSDSRSACEYAGENVHHNAPPSKSSMWCIVRARRRCNEEGTCTRWAG